MQNIKKPQTEHHSFRINKELLSDLRDISHDEQISLNTLVNQVFSSYLNWDVRAPQVGWVVMLKAALVEIIKHVDIEVIKKIAKNTAENGSKDIAMFMRGKHGIDEWISILKDRARMSGFDFREYEESGKRIMVFHHDMGENWSIFFTTYHETIFYDLGIKVKSDYTANSIMLELQRVV